MATQLLDPRGLVAFLANRLIPLDKCPGVRPIGIGETSRRIISKTIVSFLKDDIRMAAGALQLCCGHESGCEAIVHSMHAVYERDETDGILMVDADNAFNRLNRALALRNIRVVCPPIANFTLNCYRSPARLFVTGGAEISSSEGTTQGDPLAMPFYALGMTPLIQQVHGSVTQAWYADDAQAGGNLLSLRRWWDLIVAKGPSYGYFANAAKTILIIKKERLEEASRIFAGTGVQFSDGARDLGGAVGSDSFTESYLKDKVQMLCEQLERLSEIASSSPHAAHSAYVHGIRHKWTYLQRIHPNLSSIFEPLESMIREKFIPNLLGGHHVNEIERDLLSLPGKKGGMAIENPTRSCNQKYEVSRKMTQTLSNHIEKQQLKLNIDNQAQRLMKKTIKQEMENENKLHADQVVNLLPAAMQRAVYIAQEKGASCIATALPLKQHGFALTKTEFRDAVLMRYMWPLPNLPSKCVCGSLFSMEHSQMCHTGGFINMRHDAVRDILAKTMKEVLRDVQCEPPLIPLSGEIILPTRANRDNDARADIRARGFWADQQSAFFDIRVFYPHAPSYQSRSLSSLSKSFEKEKKTLYGDRIQQVEHGSFTPMVFSSCGGSGEETSAALKKLASMVAEKRKENYSHTIALLRMRLAFSLIRASIVCLRGTRWRRNNLPSLDVPSDSVLHELRADV
jgi:hypothetical protein